MEEQEKLLTQEEELELKELEEKCSKQTITKNIIVCMAIFIFLCLIYGMFVFYPYMFKLSGTWTSSENGVYQIKNKGHKSEFKIKQLSGNPDLTLVFKGDIYCTGSNRYKTRNNQPFLEVNKQGLSNESIEELKAQSESYKIETETDDILVLKYTEKAKKISFPNNQLDSLLYYELSPSYYPGQDKILKLRNSTFADSTILFNK